MTTAARPLLLIVDDDRDCASELAELLECHDYDTLCVHSQDEAQAAWMRIRPAAAIVDLGLGGDCGLDLAATWQSDGHGQFPIVLTSGHRPEAGDIPNSLGSAPFLLKPMNIAELLEVLPRP